MVYVSFLVHSLIQVLQSDYGIDMSVHRSKLLTQQDLDEADLIIPVKRDLGAYIMDSFAVNREKIRFLRNDIPDPWHQPVAAYRQCATSIDSMLNEVVDTIIQRSRSEL